MLASVRQGEAAEASVCSFAGGHPPAKAEARSLTVRAFPRRDGLSGEELSPLSLEVIRQSLVTSCQEESGDI